MTDGVTELPAEIAAALPRSLVQMAQVIGLPAVMALSRAYPGVRLKIPRHVERSEVTYKRLSGIMGDEAARLMFRHHAGEIITVPRCSQVLRDVRDLAIIADYENNMSILDLALKYALSERALRTVLKRSPSGILAELKPANDDQLNLFAEG